LSQEHELRQAEPLRCKKRKRLLHRQQKRSDDSVNASELVIDSAFLRRRRLRLGESDLRRCSIEGVDASGPLPVRLENDKLSDRFDNAALAFFASQWETAGAGVRFPVRYGGTRLLTVKIWNLSDEAHHEVFWARLFHAATRRDNGEGHRGA
jgi:hypothetical protein